MAVFNSMMACWTGPRGSGKTLSMVVDACINMLMGVKVWSNFNIEFYSDYATPGKNTHYRSLPLDMENIYRLDNEITEGWVYIDELFLWANNRRSQSTSNKLVNAAFTLIRKRRLSFGLTTQQFEWLDKQVRFQVDTLVECFDLHFKYKHLPPGALIGLGYKDLSGRSTGYPYYQTGRIRRRQLYAMPFWNCFNSWQEFDVLDAARGIRLSGGAKVIHTGDVTGAYVAEDGFEPQRDRAFLESSIASIVEQLRESGETSITSQELASSLAGMGIQTSLVHLGRILPRCGLRYHRGRTNRYDLVL